MALLGLGVFMFVYYHMYDVQYNTIFAMKNKQCDVEQQML